MRRVTASLSLLRVSTTLYYRSLSITGTPFQRVEEKFSSLHIKTSAAMWSSCRHLWVVVLYLVHFTACLSAQSTYWLANKPNVGKVAFQDPSYPVFRNVKDYGATGKH